MHQLLPFLRCPASRTRLNHEDDWLISGTGIRYPITNGIPRLLIPTKTPEEERIRQTMQAFYERFTFPGYDDIDSPGVLVNKAKKSAFGLWVDQAIPATATVLEVGCGTGQMTNFLGLVTTRTVIGADMSAASLALGQGFKERFGLKNVHFVQGNIFAMPVAEGSVDVLLCSGVLHHTPDPEGGYRKILKLVKPNGTILIGLYNRYARIPLGIRQVIFKATGNLSRALDAHMRRKDVDQSKKEIWFADQYKNPHESWHSVDEVLGWFDDSGVKFLSGVPAISKTLPEETDGLRLFREHPRGSALEHIVRQLGWMFTIGREGGLFVMVGTKDAP
ncbi:methyltransferase domain-containing protein [Candidatus Peregrinibacteria bacterium]|nr:methyltransferase domain-containing protein [Candidatus Peregrinibacteria bacterium]MBI3816618.1 methyltransferase domain-containing protein [Candidatus Peregrinibacteria bacterium]